ncbi:glycoside hydrolase family 3 N-terminal domain-containing protein [Actinoalloteichus hymeniacidonis]|uniref:Exo-alpha-(1->6)-L-arabinopyranosidase n=1 Tax=Actinoalloteichus hymeniacidonis TaxID=340345 RepID=A0AAC9HRC1_9PSEU|nr:glycoside hydrolase family 3 N-terminal domain-containing protein [Actinoalloteichus hymeniacidonis]AOS63909.1 beta-glucosidase-like glycosyl hydrolase [Actinoalloteichus hymeniacidonis]MBB5908035.1 beta-xylosidase [Actinoalloteichus hymeniacidonis]
MDQHDGRTASTPSAATSPGATEPDRLDPWQRSELPVEQRVADLLARMSLTEKLAQLVGVWVSASDGAQGVAPHQHEETEQPPDWPAVIGSGLGQLTRTFGTTPVEPVTGARQLAAAQREIVSSNRFGIPAMAHEECLAGFAAWQATIYPVPLAWGATFDPELVERMSTAIGTDLRALGVHQGLAPVLDVVRDARWGRVEETIGEDPYLVGTIGAAYVHGLESAGAVATLKHFAGYSASRAGRNLAPVSMGPREFADVILPPFEMALRHGGARSVMHSYSEIDGVPVAADAELLTGLLRERLGFTGVVVADYFGIAFLQRLHGTAADEGEAAEQALTAGVDVELPTVRCYGEPLAERVRSGLVPESLVDRALRRVLRQKCELGLLDPDWSPLPPVLAAAPDPDAEVIIDLDPPANRALARRLAEESVVLLSNPQGILPLAEPGRLAVVGPLADDAHAMLGCYSFPAHIGVSYPELPLGVAIPTVLDALRAESGAREVRTAPGCSVADADRSRIAAAVESARTAEVAVVVVGDHSGLFGRGTSGEGCDATDLALPGVQEELLAAVVDTGVPTVAVVISGRPYALGSVIDRLAAAVQLFLPGEEGASALAGVLTGRINPSGRLPVSLPVGAHGQPSTYLTPPLGIRSKVSSADPTPLFPFGHGLSYTSFRHSELRILGVDPQTPVSSDVSDPPAASAEPEDPVSIPTDGTVEISLLVANTGERAGVEVVQLYLRDPVAQVTRPVRQLVGFARVALASGAQRTVRFRLHADRTSFTGRVGRRIVEPGRIDVHVGASSEDLRLTGSFTIAGEPREVGADRVLDTPVELGDPNPPAEG